MRLFITFIKIIYCYIIYILLFISLQSHHCFASYNTNKVAATAHSNSCTASGSGSCLCAYCWNDTTEVSPVKAMFGDSCVCSASGGIKRYDLCSYTASTAAITFTTSCTRGIISTTLTPAATPSVNTIFETLCLSPTYVTEGLGLGQTVCTNESGLHKYNMNTLTYSGTKYNHFYYCTNGTNEYYLDQASSSALGSACSSSSILGRYIATNHNNASSNSGTSNTLAVGPTLACQALAVGTSHSCALTSAGAAYCWGKNTSGQLGDASSTNRTSATLVTGSLIFKQIGAGSNFSCGLNSSGNVYCWGDNTSGQLGNSTNVASTSPVAVTSTKTFRKLSVGYLSACAVTSEGAVYCWGENGNSQLGDGTTTDRNAPVLIDTDVRFADVSVGKYHACGLTHEKKIFCWGLNSSGQLGDATTTTRTTPTMITGATSFVALSATSGTAAGTSDHTCALSTVGTVYCWGENGNGQLGNGNTTDLSTPVLVSAAVNFLTIKVGGSSSCALGVDHQYYCWGSTLTGAGGFATTALKLTIPEGLEARNIGLGDAHGCLLSTAGEVLCWGSLNTSGELGDNAANTYSNHPSPIASGLKFAVQGFGACDL